MIVTQMTYDPETRFEDIDYDLPSETVPDESFTIEELIMRHRAGILTDVKTPIFTNDDSYGDEDAALDDVDLEKFDRMDPVDQEMHFAATRETVAHEPVILKDDEEISFDGDKPKINKKKTGQKPEVSKGDASEKDA